MSDTRFVRAATLDWFGDLVEDLEGVQLRHLLPFTTLLVRTTNSLYRVVITHWPEVYVQGGAFFPEPTLAYLDGARIGDSCLRVGWIGVDLPVEVRSGGRRIITSPVRAIYHRARAAGITSRTKGRWLSGRRSFVNGPDAAIKEHRSIGVRGNEVPPFSSRAESVDAAHRRS
jgi:hypothetical protein